MINNFHGIISEEQNLLHMLVYVRNNTRDFVLEIVPADIVSGTLSGHLVCLCG